MAWLKLSADTVVHICMLFGVIFAIPPVLLGATVLAWGNSMPDLANNLALARDGFPTMAITACFAAPLFTLLVGTSSCMAYGAVASGGVLVVPFGKVLGILYGAMSRGSSGLGHSVWAVLRKRGCVGGSGGVGEGKGSRVGAWGLGAPLRWPPPRASRSVRPP